MVLKPGTLVNNRYRIIEEIGVGGMAIVYKATDEKLDRDVTFKVLKEAYIDDEEFIIRFVTEARAAARLANNNIVNVYDVGNEGNINYIVMEYIEGFTLKDLICSKAPFTDEETVGIAVQIALGLRHAHKHNIVHRDIKPENILITNTGGEGTVKVTDFGIAQATNSSTSPTDNMGSVHYFSPEQAKGEKADIRSDIYSLGIVMYEMVTGKQPFDGDSAVALAMKHLKSPLPNIKEINPNVSDNLIAVIKKCTSKEPRNRYQSADALINDLRRVIGISNMLQSQKVSKTATNTESTKVIDYNENFLELENTEYEAKRKERKMIISAVIAGAVLLILLGIVGFIVNDSINGDTIKVPDFVGMNYEDAKAKAEDKGLEVDFEGVYKEDAETGEILEQSIAEGERVEKGKEILLTVNVGKDSAIVPKIVGIPKSKAEEILNESGLEFGVVKYVHSNEPSGTILKQDPEPNKLIMNGTPVNVEVSQGDIEEEVKMPDLINHTKDEASIELEKVGLKAKFIDGYSDKIEKGRIIDQGIPADTIIGVGSTVTLTVSQGKSEITTEEAEMITKAPPVVDIEDEETDEDKDEQVQEEENNNEQDNEPDNNDNNSDANNNSNSSGNNSDSNNDNSQPQKKNVSIGINPDFASGNYGVSEANESCNVKVVAKDSNGERVVASGSYKVSDFPFSVNDESTGNTEYRVYINDQLLTSENR